ncbi:hypothetical protein LIER_19771 [Lithospermum erythrorhizon]|uniref:Uncharacterized protein n=1 Tax=Lithospermum erythrorhizon TaxID=34254 RepID=A0AAV3QMQ8_LITER
MGELLTDPVFATGLVLMKAALEDFFSWVDLLADWHEELHQSHLHHIGDLRTILTQNGYLCANDQMRLESFSRELVGNESLMRSYKDTSSSYASLCVAASRRHLQESIVYALQLRQGHLAVEIRHLEKPIDRDEQLRDSQCKMESALSRELEYLERLLPILDYHVL